MDNRTIERIVIRGAIVAICIAVVWGLTAIAIINARAMHPVCISQYNDCE